MTLLAVPITADETAAAAAEVRRAIAGGADAVELRVDRMGDADPGAVAAAAGDAVVILTLRSAAEGGGWTADESTRLALLERLAPHADLIDFELAAWRASPQVPEAIRRAAARTRQGKLILSSHDFTRRPTDLSATLEAMNAEPACDVAKVAFASEDITDNLDVFEIMRASPKPVIAIVMGRAGIPSRVLARKFRAFLSFTSLAADRASAPGQATLDEMTRLYRWDAIGPQTAVYGVVGCPVAHSMSPAIHNAAFAEAGHDGVYLPMRVEPGAEAFDAWLDGCGERPWMHLGGLSVTIPHKANALRWARARGADVEPLAAKIGAVNTLAFDPAGSIRALNTDYAAALDALAEGMGCGRDGLAGLSVTVLGAGGVSRSIVAGLADCGCEVTIANRTASRAQSLAAEFGCRVLDWDRRADLDARVVVNCTSLGMWPDVEASPLPDGVLSPGMVVFDTVYNPIETRLLAQAAAAGATRIDGVAMFVNQAVAQFEAWTRRPAPRTLMREVVTRALAC